MNQRSSNAPRILAFDLGGVLVDVDHAHAATSVGVSLSQWERACFDDGLHDALTVGACHADAFVDSRARLLDVSSSQFRTAWSAVVRFREGATAWLELLRDAGERVVFWSNTDPIHAARLAEAWPGLVHAAGLSFRLCSMKPDPAFYLGALMAECDDVVRDRVVFIDDRLDNIHSAQALGIDARHHAGDLRSAMQLTHDFPSHSGFGVG